VSFHIVLFVGRPVSNLPPTGLLGVLIALANTYDVLNVNPSLPSVVYLPQIEGNENSPQTPFTFFRIETHSNGLSSLTFLGSSVQSEFG
jgi:hypothetical protein